MIGIIFCFAITVLFLLVIIWEIKQSIEHDKKVQKMSIKIKKVEIEDNRDFSIFETTIGDDGREMVLIPEGVFITVSITTRNTARFHTPLGEFEYKHIKPSLFFGYMLINKGRIMIKIAEPEKVILDYFYMNKHNTFEDVEEIFQIRREQIYSALRYASYVTDHLPLRMPPSGTNPRTA